MASKKGLVVCCTALMSLLSIVGCSPTSGSSSSTSGGSNSSSSAKAVEKANGAFSYVASDYSERAKILGQLEKYAMEKHISGITLYGDGGYSVASSRVKYPFSKYITGYGFGTARYGSIDASDPNFQIVDSDTSIPDIKEFYHSYDSTPITSMNGLDTDGSQIADYWSYFQSSFFGTRIKDDDTSAKNLVTEWYPILAKTMPVAVNKDSSTGLATKWRFQVRTGADGVTYKTDAAIRSKWNGVGVKAEDYIFALKVLLTKKVGYYRQSQYTSGSSAIKGAAAYYAASTDGYNSSAAKAAWNGVGFKLVDANGNAYTSGDAYIEVEYNTPCNDFNSYYRLSDALISPINQEFYEEVCGDPDSDSFTPENYANQSSDKSTSADKNVLSVGPYTLTRLDGSNNGDIVLTRNADWFETKANSNLYKIKGYKYRFDTNLSSDASAMINHFKAKECDASSIPSSAWDDYASSDSGTGWVKKLSGNSSTYKMNVNSCTQDRWEELFGVNGSITTTSRENYWTVKPIMSNSDFLDGIYFSTNRSAIADSMHRNKAYTYFSEAYMSDPVNSVSYNSTKEHEDAIADYITTDKDGNDTYGFDLAQAQTLFTRAAKTLTDNGTYHSGDTIKLYTYYQAQSQITQWGDMWATTIEDAFNKAASSYGLTLDIVNEATTNWYDCYYSKAMVGQFDFVFGSISGNTLDPLNFMEVLKSDNSSGFTLNWGTDTSKVDSDLVYDGKSWSYDALFNVANSGGLVKDGEMAVPYIYNDKKTVVDTDKSTITFVYDYDATLGAQANMDFDDVTVACNFSYIDSDGDAHSYYDTTAGDLYLEGENDATNHTISFTLTVDDLLIYYFGSQASKYADQPVAKDTTITWRQYFASFINGAAGASATLSMKFYQIVKINGVEGQYSVSTLDTASNFAATK